jgi:hypothetical protein
VSLFWQGRLRGINQIRIGGIALLLLVLLRLLIVEIWLMPVIVRIITFILAGSLFVLTAFLDKKLKVNN